MQILDKYSEKILWLVQNIELYSLYYWPTIKKNRQSPVGQFVFGYSAAKFKDLNLFQVCQLQQIRRLPSHMSIRKNDKNKVSKNIKVPILHFLIINKLKVLGILQPKPFR